MRTHSLPLPVVAALLALALPLASPAQPKVEETVIGAVGAGGMYVVSQNEARIAYVGAKGTRTVVSVDGVEGPVLDELFGGSAANIGNPGQLYVHNANAGGKLTTPTAVVFSEKGAHYAYIGRQGNDYVVVKDGKEIGRGPRPLLGLQHTPLSLSPGGNFAYWEEMKIEGGRGTYRLVVNGKPEPWAGHQDLVPVFSPDDKRYAYTAGTVEDYKKQVLIIDGKVASYVGHTPQWTADSKVLLTIAPGNVVLVDGKPGPYTGIQIEKVTPSTVGSRIAVIMRKKIVNNESVGILYLDGKEVPGTEGARSISFSPDGKRWALMGINPEAKSAFMILDGKKGPEYQSVSDKVYWTPDSSKAIYSISSSGRNFVVVNTEEIPVQMVASLMRGPFITPKTGGRYAFSSFDNANRNHLTIVDGKNVLPAGHAPDGGSFEFSDNGERYAFTVSLVGRNGQIGIVDNGTLNTSLGIGVFTDHGASTTTMKPFFLSPDGKYLTRVGYAQNAQGLYVNDKQVYTATNAISYASFTPDSKHLIWLAAERAPDRPSIERVIYVDGQSVARISSQHLFAVANAWKMGADGVLTCLGVVGDTLKRFRITPAADMDIDKMIVQAEEKRTAAIAEAAAAKKKAEEDAAAAAAKKKADDEAAAAKRKADAEAAAAKRKADLQAAAEAKAKARADAAAAKAAARQKK